MNLYARLARDGDWRPERTVEIDAPEKRVGLKKKSTLMLWTV